MNEQFRITGQRIWKEMQEAISELWQNLSKASRVHEPWKNNKAGLPIVPPIKRKQVPPHLKYLINKTKD